MADEERQKCEKFQFHLNITLPYIYTHNFIK